MVTQHNLQDQAHISGQQIHPTSIPTKDHLNSIHKLLIRKAQINWSKINLQLGRENLQQINKTYQIIDPKYLVNQLKSRHIPHQDLLSWILRKENTELRLRPRHKQVSIKITLNKKEMVRKQIFNKTADFLLGVEKYILYTQSDCNHNPLLTRASQQPTK